MWFYFTTGLNGWMNRAEKTTPNVESIAQAGLFLSIVFIGKVPRESICLLMIIGKFTPEKRIQFVLKKMEKEKRGNYRPGNFPSLAKQREVR